MWMLYFSQFFTSLSYRFMQNLCACKVRILVFIICSQGVGNVQRRIMQSSHDALHQNILSNWFVTSSLWRWMYWANNSIKLPSAGKIQTWLIALLRFEYHVRLYSTFSAIFTPDVVFGHFIFVSSLVERH